MKPSALSEIGSLLGQPIEEDRKIHRFSIDTRTLQTGDVYCALSGARVDGHEFVAEAFQNGAVAAIVSEQFQAKPDLGPLIRVKDVAAALQDLAKEVFAAKRPTLAIGVTGSLGKTTTKEFIAHLLATSFSVFKSPGNINTQIGLPLCILNDWKHEEVVVLEMGMTEQGQIQRLVELFPPDIAVLTKVSLVHAQNFSSLKEIAQAKAEIFAHPHTRMGIYAAEINTLYDLTHSGTCLKKRFSMPEESTDFSLFKEDGQWHFRAGVKKYQIGSVQHVPTHHLHNLLAALSAAYEAGAAPEKFIPAISELQLPERRSHLVEKRGVVFINDSYNAAAESVCAALHDMPLPKSGGKRIGILGSMLELGTFSAACHRQVGEEALKVLDHLICLGEECAPMVDVWKKLGRAVEHSNDRPAVLQSLREIVRPGDVVLLKGSFSKMMWKVLDEF